MKRKLVFIPALLILLTAMIFAAPKAAAESYTVEATAHGASIRQGAGIGEQLMGKAEKGARYEYLGEELSPVGALWYKISYKGDEGYISAAGAIKCADAGNISDGDAYGTVTISSPGAAMRTDAGLSFPGIRECEKGEKFRCIGQSTSALGGRWYEVSFGGRTGFVSAAGAVLKSSEPPVTYDNKYVVSPDYKSDYYIVVYVGSQSAVVYGKDRNGKYNVAVKRFTGSTGAPGHSTRLGQYKIWRKFRWRALVGNHFGQYCSSISSSYLFHSVPYLSANPGDLQPGEYEKLGQPASKGCIRLCVRDSKWIYDNCPIGTQVNIVDASGPAGAGVPAIRPGAQFEGWDPSDTDERSPYMNEDQ